MDNMISGEDLRLWRGVNNISLRQFSKVADLSISSISLYERGMSIRPLSLFKIKSTVEKICKEDSKVKTIEEIKEEL